MTVMVPSPLELKTSLVSGSKAVASDLHSLRARRGLYRLDNGVFVRTVLVNDRDGAFAVGIENQLGLRVEGRGVDVIADRQRGDDLSRIGIEHSHDLAAAAEKQAPVGTVHGHTTGGRAGSDGPALLNFEFARIDLQQPALVFEIVVHKTIAVRSGIFRSAIQINRARDFAGRGIDYSCAIASTVESENAR